MYTGIMQIFEEGLSSVWTELVAAGLPAFFAMAVGALAIFLIIWQRLYILELRKREERFLRAQDRQPQHSAWHDPLFAEAPFPAALTTQQGAILWGNPGFWKRFGEQAVTIQELDRVFGSHLVGLLHGKVSAHHLHLSLPDKTGTATRLFTVITWPVRQQRGTAILLTFFEQTAAQQRKQADAKFEQELIGYLHGIREQLEDESPSELTLLEIKTELETVLGLLNEHHGALRSAKAHERVNLPVVWKETFHPLAAIFRRRKVHFAVALPHDQWVHAQKEDATRSLQLLLEAVADLAEPGMTLHVSLRRQKNSVRLELTIPELVLPERQTQLLFSFGTRIKRTQRFAALQLKLALVKQLANKYHGNLDVFSTDGLGTVLQLTFANAE